MSTSELKIARVGGTMDIRLLTSVLDERSYELNKAGVWLELLKLNRKPEKWRKATKGGTKVDFVIVKTQAEADSALAEFRGYVEGLNQKYPGLDLEITNS